MIPSKVAFFSSVIIDNIDNNNDELNCGVLSPRTKGWTYWKCLQTAPIQCACEKQKTIYLRLRGRCTNSIIDIYWNPQNKKGQFFLHGTRTSEIRKVYNNNNQTPSSDRKI